MPIDTETIVDEPEVLAGNGVAADEVDAAQAAEPEGQREWRLFWRRVLAYGILPGLALILAGGAGYLKWQVDSARISQTARIPSVQAATDSTVALLSYRPDTVEKDLTAARDRLTGTFRDTYTDLINKVVIPGSKQKNISAVANVPAVGSISAAENRAVVLVFVNQTITIGKEAPTSTASSVRITLDKVGDRWLISQFDPV